MRLFDSKVAPNPRRVRMFLAEKGVDVPRVAVDIGRRDQFAPDFAALNPLRAIPVLQLDDGEVLTESIAICRYFEELHPQPPLFGVGALGKARVEMWQRRLELELFFPVAMKFRHTHPAMQDLQQPRLPDYAAASEARALAFLAWLDGDLKDRPFVAGDAFSVADITGLVAIDWMRPARIPLPENLANVRRWRDSLAARPSAAA